ncbi:putative tubulin/FtsZ, GTPase domain superfamily [Helianthus annuus]|nr:putative tubulin/FtsZ, GTPase domain superfamily [Helianthus annuus]KAJ0554723.1 putative tubulin/FtsZ, GTPase domain superfamily [Helianthus annuus]
MLNLYAFVRKAASDSDNDNDEGKSNTSSELGEPITLKVMGISVSSVCISVHIGQAGIQVGNSRWKLYCLEHVNRSLKPESKCHYLGLLM